MAGNNRNDKCKSRLRKDDEVIVVAGREKGKRGKIMFVDRNSNRAVIQGINMNKRFQRPTQENPKGGVLEMEAPIHISNIMFYDSGLKKGVRLGVKRNTEGKNIRVTRPAGKEV